MGSEEYISEIGGKFSIDRIFNDKKYNFGIFETYDEALNELDYLEEEGWPISKSIVEKNAVIDKLGLSLDNIEEIDGKFIVFKFINNEKIIFGKYDSLDDAKQIRDNLIDNAWESMEPNDRSKYGKYIRKSHNRFVVSRTYKGTVHNFGYFNTFDEALDCREKLVATNWGDLNIPHEMRCGKYISFNGKVYSLSKTLEDGTLNVYGFFNELEDAIKQREWLIAHNWSRLEVPDDSKRHIHKNGNEYLVYKRLKDDIEYFGTYPTLEEAKLARNKLIENDWVIPEEKSDIEQVSDFVYFDGEFYIIQKETDGQRRIYGIYKKKNQAIADEKSFIKYDWDGVYAIPTQEYPYGENIVPFDYIFILESNENGIKEELGTYYSFRDIVLAREEFFSDEGEGNDKLIFSVKIGKSYKNRGWAIIRDSTYDLIPKLPYEDECDIIVDGIPTTARFNLLPRIFYTKTKEVVDHLEKLANTNPEGRINVELLLNKEGIFGNSNSEIKHLNLELSSLKKENSELTDSINELKDILNYIDDENSSYLKKFSKLDKLIKEFDDSKIATEELNSIPDSELRLKVYEMIAQFDSIKKTIEND